MIPIAGSAYTYAYTTLGEIVAWIIGWDLILEYSFGAATVAVGWAGYFSSSSRSFGIHMPARIADPLDVAGTDHIVRARSASIPAPAVPRSMQSATR